MDPAAVESLLERGWRARQSALTLISSTEHSDAAHAVRFEEKSIMNVASMMSYPVFTATRDTPVAEVVRTMSEHRVSAVPIVDEEKKVLGVVTVADLIPEIRNAPASNVPLMALQDEYVDFTSIGGAYEKLARLAASEVMRQSVVTITPEIEIGVAAQVMLEHRIAALPVVRNDGVLVGIMTRTDVARLSLERKKP